MRQKLAHVQLQYFPGYYVQTLLKLKGNERLGTDDQKQKDWEESDVIEKGIRWGWSGMWKK